MVYHKVGSGVPSVGYADAVEEALCFGWIDSQVKPMDELRYRQLFTPRQPGSTWSRVNKERVERLIAEGLMLPVGLAKIEAAQRNGSWTFLDDVEAARVPNDLAAALAATPAAEANFAAFPYSCRKQAIYWVISAKREPTRAKRIAEVVRASAENRRPR